MEKRLVTRYEMRSTEDADENERRVEGVFAELAETKPDNGELHRASACRRLVPSTSRFTTRR